MNMVRSYRFASMEEEQYDSRNYIGRFYTRGRIIRLDELGQTFVVRLVIHL